MTVRLLHAIGLHLGRRSRGISTDGMPVPVGGLRNRCMTAAACTWAAAAEAAAAAAEAAHIPTSMVRLMAHSAHAHARVPEEGEGEGGAGSRRRRNSGRDGRSRRA
jgi:hypothetical protein